MNRERLWVLELYGCSVRVLNQLEGSGLHWVDELEPVDELQVFGIGRRIKAKLKSALVQYRADLASCTPDELRERRASLEKNRRGYIPPDVIADRIREVQATWSDTVRLQRLGHKVPERYETPVISTGSFGAAIAASSSF